jgi:hypothetical protein
LCFAQFNPSDPFSPSNHLNGYFASNLTLRCQRFLEYNRASSRSA